MERDTRWLSHKTRERERGSCSHDFSPEGGKTSAECGVVSYGNVPPSQMIVAQEAQLVDVVV